MSSGSSLVINDDITDMSLYNGLLYVIQIDYGIVDHILAFVLACALPITCIRYIYQPYRGMHKYRLECYLYYIVWSLLSVY